MWSTVDTTDSSTLSQLLMEMEIMQLLQVWLEQSGLLLNDNKIDIIA